MIWIRWWLKNINEHTTGWSAAKLSGSLQAGVAVLAPYPELRIN